MTNTNWKTSYSFKDKDGDYCTVSDFLGFFEEGSLTGREDQVFYVALQKGWEPSLWIPYHQLQPMLELSKEHEKQLMKLLWKRD